MLPEQAQLQDFARRYTQAWCSQDPARVAACYSPQGSLKINDGAPAEGRNAITEAARSFMTSLPDMQVLMDEVISNGDRVEYHWTLVGTNTGPGGTGNKIHISGYEVWRFGDDRLIAESQGHFDSADYQQQIDGRK